MYCRLCKRFNTRNERNGIAVFNNTPCISLHRDAISRHAGTGMHKVAVQLEYKRLASKRTGGIMQAFSDAISTERKAALGAMKCLYWQAKMKLLTPQNMFHCSNLRLSWDVHTSLTYTGVLMLRIQVNASSRNFEYTCISD